MAFPPESETYRRDLIRQVCATGRFLAVYCGDDPERKELAREANQVAKLQLDDRRMILKHIVVKPLNLEKWR